jgi:hypothetical protein
MAMMFLLLSTARAIAPNVNVLPVVESRPVDIYETLMQAILQVESAGDTMAYNPVEQAYGPFQIRPIRLTDYNKRTGKAYLMRDCYTLRVSREVFRYYAVRIGSDYETIARKWNGSGVMTVDYWRRVKNVLDQQEKKLTIKIPS